MLKLQTRLWECKARVRNRRCAVGGPLTLCWVPLVLYQRDRRGKPSSESVCEERVQRWPISSGWYPPILVFYTTHKLSVACFIMCYRKPGTKAYIKWKYQSQSDLIELKLISATQSLICQMKKVWQYIKIAYRIFECLNLNSSLGQVLIDLSFLCDRWFCLVVYFSWFCLFVLFNFLLFGVLVGFPPLFFSSSGIAFYKHLSDIFLFAYLKMHI